jgi:hypothetical protein
MVVEIKFENRTWMSQTSLIRLVINTRKINKYMRNTHHEISRFIKRKVPVKSDQDFFKKNNFINKN